MRRARQLREAEALKKLGATLFSVVPGSELGHCKRYQKPELEFGWPKSTQLSSRKEDSPNGVRSSSGSTCASVASRTVQGTPSVQPSASIQAFLTSENSSGLRHSSRQNWMASGWTDPDAS